MNDTLVQPAEAPQTSVKKGMNKRKIAMILVLGGIVSVFLAFNLYFIIPITFGNDSTTCRQCHAMAPEYATWQASNHAQFQCKDCHQQPGVTNLFKYQLRMVKEFLIYRASDSPHTIKATPIPDSVCEKCHSSNRRASASSDTIIPHDKHKKQGVSCVTCHAGVAHGRIMERGALKKYPTVQEWTPDVGVEQMSYDNTTPKMDVCLNCHGQRKVNTTCSVCHSHMPVPDSHKSPSWLAGSHGTQALQDFKPCNLCHVYTMKKEIDLLSTNVFGYIRTNNFCINCHTTQKPPTHVNGFMASHGALAKQKGTTSCFVCHNLNKSQVKAGGWPNRINCNDCHWFKNGPS